MKKLVLFLVLSLLSVSIQAQDFTPPYYIVGKLYPGYVVLTDGTKIEGYLEALPQASDDLLASTNQNKVIFYTDPKSRKTKKVYKPTDLKSYRIDDKEYITLNYGGLGKALNFVLLTKKGRIDTFTWYEYNTDKGQFEGKIVLRKADEKPLDMSYFLLGFAKKMSEYIADYELLASKVSAKAKGFGLLNVLDIIAEYNEWYAKNNP
jgi:hypothetical protein